MFSIDPNTFHQLLQQVADLQAMIPEDLVPVSVGDQPLDFDARLRALVEIARGKTNSLG